MIARKFVLQRHFDGEPEAADLELVEETVPATLADGEVLCEAVWLSVDPYMRIFSKRLHPGDLMIGDQVARVVESKNSNFPKGSHVLGRFGWRTHTVVSDESSMTLIPPSEDLPLSLFLGLLGMPGATAYFGLLDICNPQPGETVLVSAAAGAVGSVVGQIAKIKGCKVIGFAGSHEKCAWLKELGFDFAFNYKTVDVDKVLDEVAPDGIDCYFDNVGGLFSCTVLKHMKDKGRVSVCGSISTYNSKDEELTGSFPSITIIFRQLRIQGFVVSSMFKDHFFESREQLKKWLKQGKIKYKETITEGFENMPKAFFALFKGGNTGKAVVKI